MDGIPDNQSSRNIFDAFLRTTKSQHRHFVPHNIKPLFQGRKKLLLLPAVGVLAVGIPIVAAESFSNDSNNPTPSNTSSSSDSSQANHQDIQFQEKNSSSGASSQQETSLTVNGQPIPVPDNGHLKQTFSNGTQSTTIEANNHNEQNTLGENTSNTSSSTITIKSNSTNESRGSP